MENVSHTITTVLGVVMVGLVTYEINRRRKQLREVYDVLETEDRQVVSDLEHMVATGLLKPYTGEAAA
jgi:alpha-D-ribose 1-methylphosphonate 5-triphosphate diphosphatase PhnM